MSENEQADTLELFNEFKQAATSANAETNNRQHLLSIVDQAI